MSSDHLKKLIEVNSNADEMRAKLLSILNRDEESLYELPDGYKSAFEAFKQKEPLGDIVVAFLSKSSLEEDEKYWIRLALHALNRYDWRIVSNEIYLHVDCS